MSREYSMYMQVSGFDKDKREAIQTAAEEEWDFDDWGTYAQEKDLFLFASGDGALTGGESDEEFARRLALAVWKANGKYCFVHVAATCLENFPCETYELGLDDYEKAMEGK